MTSYLPLSLFVVTAALGSALAPQSVFACPLGTQPFHIVFKESFKFQVPPFPAMRRFYSFDGCKRETSTSCTVGVIHCTTNFDITAEISFGQEAASNPLLSEPLPVPPVQTRAFDGTLVRTGFVPHGDLTELTSSDFAIEVHGNWFYNKNLSISFDGAVLPVSIGPISAGFPFK